MNPLETFSSHAGQWEGSNRLHDPNTHQAEDSPMEASLMPILGGKFLRLDYTWGYQGTPQEGFILFGVEPRIKEISLYWGDTWHMGNQILVCKGKAASSREICVTGSYAAPPGPDWGWRIVLKADGSLVTLHMYNITPEGQEAIAVEALLEKMQ